MPDELDKTEVPVGNTGDKNNITNIPINSGGGGGPGKTAGGLEIYDCPSCSFVASREKLAEYFHHTVMTHIAGCQGKKGQSEEKMVGKDTLPTLDAQAGTLAPQKWNFFRDRWRTFMRLQSVQFSQSRINATIASCFPALQDRITTMCQRRVDDPRAEEMSTEELLDQVRLMVVGNVDVLRQRQHMYKMHQASGEPVREFLERLRSQGELCELKIVLDRDMKKGEEVHYMEWAIRDCLVCGLEDREIQKKITTDEQEHTKLTVEKVLEFVERHEDIENRAPEQMVNAISAYKSNKKAAAMPPDGRTTDGRRRRVPVPQL